MVQGGVIGDVTSYFSEEKDGDVDGNGNGNGGYFGDGFSVSDTYKSLGFQSEDIHIYSYLANKGFEHISMEYSYRQAYNLQRICRNPVLNLKFKSFDKIVDSTFPPEQVNHHTTGHGVVGRPRKSDFVSQQVTEKLKASNFSASLLKIGTWERTSKHEGDLVAKCYYAKKKLVWEFLEMSLKRKIEIQWIDILAIRATTIENEPGILEIELKQPPSFHHETDPQPRKHTNWKPAADFTDGQAPTWRRHYLKFPPGVLDKPFEKLLQCDSRLNELSQKPFPSSKSPFFLNSSIYEPMNLSFNLHGQLQRPQFNHALNYSLAHIHNTPYVPEQVQTYQQIITPPLSIRELASPDSVMEFSPIAEHQYVEHPRMAYWGQGVNNFADTLVREQVQGHMSLLSVAPTDILHQNNNNYNEASGRRRDLDTEMLLNDIENTLMSDSQLEYTDQKYSLARIASMDALISPANEGNDNFACNTVTNHTNYGHNMGAAMHLDFSTNQHSHEASGIIFPPPISWVAPQVTDIPQPVSVAPTQVTNDIPMNQPRNNSFYPVMDDFATANSNNGVNRWP